MFEIWNIVRCLGTIVFMLLSILAFYFGIVCFYAIFLTWDGLGALTSLLMGIVFCAISVGLAQMTIKMWEGGFGE